MVPLGSGGLKTAFLALHYVKLENGKIERRPDCAWVEAEGKNAQIALNGYELAQSLDEHPNVYRPWRLEKWVNDEQQLTRVVALEPRFRTSLDRVNLPWNEMLSCMRQITEGLAFMHKCLVVHKDLKPSNIGLKLVDGRLVPVITDCDTWRYLQKEGNVFVDGQRDGSPAYMAPECYFNENYGPKVDVWALGLIFYEQVWRSVGGVKVDDGAYLPAFVENAMKIYKVEIQKKPPYLPDISKVGEALCNHPPLKWPEGVPEEIQRLVLDTLHARKPLLPSLARNMLELGYKVSVWPVDQCRCTVEEVLKKIPEVVEL